MNIRDLFITYADLSREDIVFILCEVLSCQPSEILPQINLTPNQLKQFRSWAERLRDHEPPQYIIHKAWFYGLEFYVDQRVLIPRFDTECLLEALIKYLKGKEKILEIGIGSGAISITLKHLFPELNIICTDINPAAIEVANINASKHKVQIQIVQADLFPDTDALYDVIVSNPPYISPDEYDKLEPKVRDHEPRIALYAESDGLEFYKRILAKADMFLKKNSILAFEHGAFQQKALIGLTENRGYEILQKGRDLANRDRFLILKKI
nr:release factor glutamine methyltransferase [Candidatus Cloacimonadota bacterium]